MKQILPTILLAVLFSACGSKIELTNLTVESQDGSQALATAQPRFSWQYETEQSNVMQTTYRIVVASTR
jgi:alpha-L-rhamnosidase